MGKEKKNKKTTKNNNKNKTKPKFEKVQEQNVLFYFTYVHQISQKSVNK